MFFGGNVLGKYKLQYHGVMGMELFYILFFFLLPVDAFARHSFSIVKCSFFSVASFSLYH
ncbi:hypothetical protein L873DRAFT_1730783 [Choiromyces venosus 120613-1]|uniref:Uncharacterized protein n=1 Tax=Choiromyces venosus 120613-1 TaxID=1336337 RepID=A0A3N4JZH6_9PEZI|nr:hypothetical protein L873DRAFT_1730783 [Choiromyces venosus 120613-1]